LPKDVQALLTTARDHACPLQIVDATHRANQRQRLRFAARVLQHTWPGSILAVWGLAFKARTDDVRESPALTCIEQFLQAGLTVRAYDPQARETARVHLDGTVTLCADAYEAAAGADGLVVATDWHKFRCPDFERLRRTMRRDCRRTLGRGWRAKGPAHNRCGALP
jgi:UDPglucose 6-dehydrogenase